MADLATIELRGGPGYIRFDLGWPYEEIAGYMPTTVAVDSGVFRGGFVTNTWVQEWQALRQTLWDLDQHVGQDAKASTDFSDDVGIALVFSLDRHGHLALQIAIQLHERSSTLQYSIDADQTFLVRWVHAIDEVLAQLPVS